MGLPWCVTFVHAVIGRTDILGDPCPGSRTLMRRMKQKGMWRGRDYVPVEGDLIFCANDGKRVDHVGIVESADRRTVVSIDGNSRGQDNGPDEWKGGIVARRIRSASDPMIRGYAAIGKLIGQQR